MIKQLLLVALGGGAGSVLRYLTTLGLSRQACSFPLGTFVVNIAGCLIIGFLMGLSVRFNIFNNELRYLLIAGFCGGYTTFSTFSAENLKLLEAGNYMTLVLYIAGSVVLGLFAVWGGNVLSKLIV